MKHSSRVNEPTSINEMTIEDWQVINNNLRNYNIEQSEGLSTKPGTSINLTLKNEIGEIVGGIRSRAYYHSLTIDYLWIDEKFRKMGYGKYLLLKAEKLAKEEGCISANTSSYSFQAPEFYQKLGYEILGIFEGYPEGIKKYFLGKRF